MPHRLSPHKHPTTTGVNAIGGVTLSPTGMTNAPLGPLNGAASIPATTVIGTATPGTSWALSYTQNPTIAEKAELVLALLLSKLEPDTEVSFTEVDDHVRDTVAPARGEYVDEELYLVRVNTSATFEEIVDALYAQLGNIRGRALK